MIINVLLNFAFLSLFYVSVIHGRFLAPGPPEGLCSAVTIHGFKCKEYTVKTDDGYILSVQRIPEGRSGPSGGGISQPRQPVLLQHGIIVDGMTWLMNSPEQSLAMMLADNGYDVWISNIRGTRFSRRHVILDPIQPEFWNYTWVDLANHDLPSVIDFVFKETGQQMYYVGHSMGTLIALVALSEGKLENVKSAALLSPIAYLSHVKSEIVLAAADFFIGEVGETIGVLEFDPNGLEAENLLKVICITINCEDLVTVLSGQDCCLNDTTAENFIANDLQSTSTKNLVHFAQNVRNGILSKFDYGNVYENIAHYGVASPPLYNLTNIPTDFPLFISHGGQDTLSDAEDVALLLGNLKAHDRDKLQVQFIEQYAHVDFIMALNANELVYNHIIDFFRKHN
ncbi:hypothetical protein CASFOL_003495 [Castilleja foliolosa]|uniref:Lipase n=1 Tax=Castilleja foliolosa TaxID=1961234 RepID=A0ABD3EKQ1_9LAMI